MSTELLFFRFTIKGLLKVGEHVGGGIRIPSWTATNRFNRAIVCDHFDAEDVSFDESLFAKYYNHGRRIYDNWSMSYSESKAEWILEGPTCIEAGASSGYRIRRWIISGLDAERGIIPKCILDSVTGSGDCDSDWEDRQFTAVTSRSCIAATGNADFFCDTLCASDGYGLPYNEIRNELANNVAAAMLQVPAVLATDSYGRKGMPLWNYLARSGYITSWRNLDGSNPNDWLAMKAKLVAKWEKYHTKEGDFTCKGAYGEVPENHFSVHRKIFSGPGTWVLEGLSGIQAQ